MNKVLILNGSPHQHGCTATALDEMIKVFEEEGVGTELIRVGTKDIRGCISCNKYHFLHGQVVLQYTFFKAYEGRSCSSKLQKRRQYGKLHQLPGWQVIGGIEKWLERIIKNRYRHSMRTAAWM